MPAVELRQVCKSFGETKALSDANLTAELGEIHAVVGENGSGKSTLAKIISGVIAADGGEIDVLGTRPGTPAAAIAAGVATIYQEILLAEDLSVWENVFAGVDRPLRRVFSTAEKRRLTAETLSRLADTRIDPNAVVGTLPLNIKQWIVIARAILRRPRLLIFDESSAALDLAATNRLHKEMLALKEQGACIILVTHRIAELVRIADSATVLRDGVTVGRLAKSELTEARLLNLMSATSGHSARARSDKKVVSTAQKPVLEAHALRLGAESSPVDFKVHPGEIVGLAGLDGAGHTEFIMALAGIRPPASGDIQMWNSVSESVSITALRDAKTAGIAYVSGDRKREGIFPNLSILENFGLALYDKLSRTGGIIDRPGVRKAFDAERARLGIKLGARSDKITTLSGGNQQKVLIARAFAEAPRVILLNDPARGVDIGTKQDLYRQLRSFASDGGAVVYLTSEIEELFNFADRADVFFNGSIFATFNETDIDEDHLLAAMFGRREHAEFDPDIEPQRSEKKGGAA